MTRQPVHRADSVHWERRHLGRLPCGLVSSILVDQVSTEDEQSLEQGRGHVGPGKLHDVFPDDIQALAGSSYDGDLAFSTDVVDDLLSTLIKS
jgi:hypothetical protein